MSLCYYLSEKFYLKSTIKFYNFQLKLWLINNIKNSLYLFFFFTEKYTFFKKYLLPMTFLCYPAKNYLLINII